MRDYPLAKLGTGRELHSLMPNGKTHCWKYFKSDPYPMENVAPTGDSGKPTCHWCRKELGLT